MRLRGGNDWERILEDAIRNKAAKFLLVATPVAVEKQGVRNEIRLATETAKKNGDTDFIVPLRVEPFEPTLGTAHAQWVDFSKGWAAGLSELLALLGSATSIKPSVTDGNAEIWRGIQLKDARAVGPGPETLISNWLAIEALPERIQFYDFKSGISIGAAEKAKQSAAIPLVAHNRGFLTFAPLHQLQEYFGPELPIDLVAQQPTLDFLDAGWADQTIRQGDARRKFADITRRALDSFFEAKGLLPFEIASGHNAWWPKLSDPLKGMIAFGWPNGPAGRRQIIGKSDKRGFHWHFGVTCSVRSTPKLVQLASLIARSSHFEEPFPRR